MREEARTDLGEKLHSGQVRGQSRLRGPARTSLLADAGAHLTQPLDATPAWRTVVSEHVGAGDTWGQQGGGVSGARSSREAEGIGCGGLAAGFVETKAYFGRESLGTADHQNHQCGTLVIKHMGAQAPAQAGCTEPSRRGAQTTVGVSTTALQAGTLTQGRHRVPHRRRPPGKARREEEAWVPGSTAARPALEHTRLHRHTGHGARRSRSRCWGLHSSGASALVSAPPSVGSRSGTCSTETSQGDSARHTSQGSPGGGQRPPRQAVQSSAPREPAGAGAALPRGTPAAVTIGQA